MSTRGIHNNHFIIFFFECLDSQFSNSNWISFGVTSVEWNSDFCSILFQLIEGSCSESISTNQSHSITFLLPIIGIFRTGSSLTSSLKTDKHDNIALSLLWLERFFLSIQKTSKFSHNFLLDNFLQICGLILLNLKLHSNIFSHLTHISNINICL